MEATSLANGYTSAGSPCSGHTETKRRATQMRLSLSGGRRRMLARRGISRAVFRTATFQLKSDLRRPGAEGWVGGLASDRLSGVSGSEDVRVDHGAGATR